MPLRLTDLLVRAPEATIVRGQQRLAYADLRERVARRAAGLRAWGVRSRDRVALHLPDPLAWLELWFATAWLDADLVAVETGSTDSEVRYVLEDSNAAWLVWGPATPEEHPARVHHLVHGLPLMLTLDPPVAGDLTPSEETDAAALVRYTSGATPFPQAEVVANASLVRESHALGVAWGVTSDDVVLVTDPVRGGSAFLAGAAHGASVVLADRWPAADAIRVLREEGVTVVPRDDATVRDLLAHARATGERIPALRLVPDSQPDFPG